MPATRNAKTVAEVRAYVADLTATTEDIFQAAHDAGLVACSAQLFQLEQIAGLTATTTGEFRAAIASMLLISAAILPSAPAGSLRALALQGQHDILCAVASFIDSPDVTRG